MTLPSLPKLKDRRADSKCYAKYLQQLERREPSSLSAAELAEIADQLQETAEGRVSAAIATIALIAELPSYYAPGAEREFIETARALKAAERMIRAMLADQEG